MVARGFSTILRFIATASADVNVQRVVQRAQTGGHAASETEVRATYAASLSNLSDAVPFSSELASTTRLGTGNARDSLHARSTAESASQAMHPNGWSGSLADPPAIEAEIQSREAIYTL